MSSLQQLYDQARHHFERAGYIVKKLFGFTISFERKTGPRTQTVHISRRTRTRYSGDVRRTDFIGFSISVSVSTSLMTRVGICKKDLSLQWFADKLARWFRMETYETSNNLLIRTKDLNWAKSLTETIFFHEFSKTLFSGQVAPPETVSISFTPNNIAVLLRAPDLSTNRLTLITDLAEALAHFASHAEALPPPTRRFEKSLFERYATDNPILTAVLVLAAGLLFFFVLGLGMVGLILLVTAF